MDQIFCKTSSPTMASARVSPPVAPWLNKRKRRPTWTINFVITNTFEIQTILQCITSCLALARPIAAPTLPTATPAPKPRPASTRI